MDTFGNCANSNLYSIVKELSDVTVIFIAS